MEASIREAGAAEMVLAVSKHLIVSFRKEGMT